MQGFLFLPHLLTQRVSIEKKGAPDMRIDCDFLLEDQNSVLLWGAIYYISELSDLHCTFCDRDDSILLEKWWFSDVTGTIHCRLVKKTSHLKIMQHWVTHRCSGEICINFPCSTETWAHSTPKEETIISVWYFFLSKASENDDWAFSPELVRTCLMWLIVRSC